MIKNKQNKNPMAVTLGALGGKKRWKGKTKADKKEFIAMLNRKRLEKLSKVRAEKEGGLSTG